MIMAEWLGSFEEMVIKSGLLILFLYVAIPYVVYILCHHKNQQFSKMKSALVVTAHPDDECMFFSPTIIGLQHKGIKVYLLCLSTGNFYGDGEIRMKELKASCKRLGIDNGNCNLVNDSSIPDDPNVTWPSDTVSKYVHQEIFKTKADLVISFDKGGVSGHSNHVAVSEGIK